ncbi:MAG: CRISPR-associated protein Cas4 [Actinobacteria bacterium]|nr:CRISPR-associated protein Cas4 [Actinomycetota bacterium]
MNKEGFWSVSDILNHAYCPWITYHWHVLKIPQSKTTKTEEGINKQREYARKVRKHPERGVGGIRGAKFIPDRSIRSVRLMLAGKCDYVLYPGSVPAPLEIKNGKIPPRSPHGNTILQLACYAIMLEEELKAEVHVGYIYYLRDGLTQKIEIFDKDKRKVESLIAEMNSLLENEIVTGKPMSWRCCWDCCYRKICALGGGS